MHEDVERCLRAVRSKDARFDGWFFTAVVTTGIGCRLALTDLRDLSTAITRCRWLLDLDADPVAVPEGRREPFVALVDALARNEIDVGLGSDWGRARAQLAEIPGIGTMAVAKISMRALGDPDAFTPADPNVRRGAGDVGLPTTPAALTGHAAAWRPWRAYAAQYLRTTPNHHAR